MKSTTLFRNLTLRLGARSSIFLSRPLIRHSSTETTPLADLEASLRKLTSRPENEIYDYLNITNSHLLNITLADFLPSSCYPLGFSKSNLQTPRDTISGQTDCTPPPLPLGHHLVYFSPQVLEFDLLPDGTDFLHFPGHPFSRRLWTGGSLSFNRNPYFQLHTANMSALCKEEITKVWTAGQEGDEKVFVTIRRRIGGFGRRSKPSETKIDWGHIDTSSIQWRSKLEKLALVETRTLVFMREKSKAAARRDAQITASSVMKRLMRRQ
jgi:hypothetical protein